jgi:hypothetical protein
VYIAWGDYIGVAKLVLFVANLGGGCGSAIKMVVVVGTASWALGTVVATLAMIVDKLG